MFAFARALFFGALALMALIPIAILLVVVGLPIIAVLGLLALPAILVLFLIGLPILILCAVVVGLAFHHRAVRHHVGASATASVARVVVMVRVVGRRRRHGLLPMATEV